MTSNSNIYSHWTPQQAYDKLSAQCAARELCSADIFKHATMHGLTRIQIEPLLQKLKDEKFVDDTRFARMFVKEKFNLYAWGRMKILAALHAKAIDQQICLVALQEIDQQQYLQTLQNIIQNKARIIKTQDQQTKQVQLIRYAASKGYEKELIQHCLRTINNQQK